MAHLTDVDNFDDVYQYEVTDPLLGGAGGIFNTQPQNLANRTRHLLNLLTALTGHLNDGTLEFDLANGSIAVTQAADDNTTLVATDEFVHKAINQQTGRRNFIINGAMRIAQRPNVAGQWMPVQGTPSYSLDRWLMSLGAGSPARSCIITQETSNAWLVYGTGAGTPAKYALKAALGAGANSFSIKQRIESVFSMQGGNATIQMNIMSSVNQTVTVKLNLYGDSSHLLHTVSGTFSVIANTAAVKTVTLAVPAILVGDWPNITPGQDFIELEIDFPSASAYNLWLTQVQVEKGSFASSFERISYSADLNDCKRYYEHIAYQIHNESTPGGSFTGKFWNDVVIVEKRATPSVSVANVATTSLTGFGPGDFSSVAVSAHSVNEISVSYTFGGTTTSFACHSEMDLYADSDF